MQQSVKIQLIKLSIFIFEIELPSSLLFQSSPNRLSIRSLRKKGVEFTSSLAVKIKTDASAFDIECFHKDTEFYLARVLIVLPCNWILCSQLCSFFHPNGLLYTFEQEVSRSHVTRTRWLMFYLLLWFCRTQEWTSRKQKA